VAVQQQQHWRREQCNSAPAAALAGHQELEATMAAQLGSSAAAAAMAVQQLA